MKALKCDLCGCYYDGKSVHLTTKNYNNVNLVHFSITLDYEVTELDICSDCVKALQEVINTRSKKTK